MVIKLIKREFKDSKRYYGPTQIAIIGMFVLLGMSLTTVGNTIGPIISGIAILGFLGLFFGALVVSLLANIYILYTSIYGDRGYDLFVMPVSPFQIILAKMLTIALWTLISAASTVLGFFIFATIVGSLSDLWQGFQIIMDNFYFIVGDIDFAYLGLILASLAVSAILSSALILFAGAVANSSKVQKNRGVVAVIVYFVINYTLNIITSLASIGSDPFFLETMDTSTMMAAIGFDLAIAGLLIYGVIWIWNNKLEIL